MIEKLSNIGFLICQSLLTFLTYFLSFFFRIILVKHWIPRSNKSVLFLEVFPEDNAGYRNRALIWSKILRYEGYNTNVLTLIKQRQKFEILLRNHFKYFLLLSTLKRIFQLIFVSLFYKVIIVRRELLLYNDYGNLFMEKLLFALHKKENVLLDFDDDISFAKNENRVVTLFGKLLLEKPDKFSRSLQMYGNFIVCSGYLKKMVLSKNNNIKENNVAVIPTCVEIPGKKKDYSKIGNVVKLGWIGSNGNQKYLDDIITDLNAVNKIQPIELVIISGKEYESKFAEFPIVNIKWQSTTQYEELMKVDIGLMPLRQTPEDKGKCGFKLLQYMSLGIVSVASPITVNEEIIKDNNGFLVYDSWGKTLIEVLNIKDKWPEIGEEARMTVIERYSFESNKLKYLNFITKCAE